MLRNLVKLYGDVNEGDYEKGIRELALQVEEESKNLIAEMITKPIMLGIPLSSILSKDIEDTVFTSTLMFWALLGKDYKEMWGEPTLFLDDDGSAIMKMEMYKCIFCAGETLESEKFGGFNTGEIFAAIIRSIVQAIQDYVGNDYEVTAKETKCFMRGDEKGEITVWIKPR